MTYRKLPNIIITGTPGCGKTSHCESIVQQLSNKFEHLNVSDFAIKNKCIEEFDDRLNTSVVDDDKLFDATEVILRKGGILVDWHSCDLFPERLIDLVIVLRTDNSILYDRLKKRNYSDVKINENLDAEIFNVILNEANESYKREIVIEMKSENIEDMENNVDRIIQWIELWEKDHPEGTSNEIEDFDYGDEDDLQDN